MKALIQRVSSASVKSQNETLGEINQGLVVLLGVEQEDEKLDGEILAKKLAELRIFSNEEGWIEGFEVGCSQTEENMQHKINIEKMKLNVMRNKYSKLKKVYEGTVIQLQNTHTLNMNMKKTNKTLPRTLSYDSYLK